MIFSLLSVVAITIFVFVTFLFLLSVLLTRNDVADVAWGVGIVIVVLVSYVYRTADSLLLNVIFVLVILWGVRLSLRIFFRNRKKDEDFRYKKWREEWGNTFYVRSYLQVYLLQGALMIVVGYPFIHASAYASSASIHPIAILGVLLWSVGYFFEVIGDYQLDTFLRLKRPAGAILTTGLWKFSRHPNYFGEVTMWWGMWLTVVSLPFGFFALMSPLMITFLILKVSGIPMLEKHFAGNPAFEAYMKKTSAFFPLPPKERD